MCGSPWGPCGHRLEGWGLGRGRPASSGSCGCLRGQALMACSPGTSFSQPCHWAPPTTLVDGGEQDSHKEVSCLGNAGMFTGLHSKPGADHAPDHTSTFRFLGDSRPAICIFKSLSRSFQIKEAIRVATHGQQGVLCPSHEPVEEHLGAQWPGQCPRGLGAMASPPLPGFSGFILALTLSKKTSKFLAWLGVSGPVLSVL